VVAIVVRKLEKNMANLKRAASSPLSKDGKKAKEDECLICLEMATENVLECVWCEGRIQQWDE